MADPGFPRWEGEEGVNPKGRGAPGANLIFVQFSPKTANNKYHANENGTPPHIVKPNVSNQLNTAIDDNSKY